MSILELLEAIHVAVPANAEFTADDFEQMDALIGACFMASENRDHHPVEIANMLKRLDNGFGDWLGTVRDAVAMARIPEPDRQRIGGALGMACVFLFDLFDRGRSIRP